MGIALRVRPPVGEILVILRFKSIENPLLFVNSECIWSSRIVKKIRLRRAETKKIGMSLQKPKGKYKGNGIKLQNFRACGELQSTDIKQCKVKAIFLMSSVV